ncbi:hypothetical protein M0805_001889 [Coniferiporia weirii]|nr:hypothetical protein M0805_001889 [Coniferiporia weirii]
MAVSVDRLNHYVGNSAFDNDRGGYISFPSRSDAMIASLALAYSASPGVMDAVFSIIQDTSFNPSEMKLRRTEDIYVYLSKCNSQADTPGVTDSALGKGRRFPEGPMQCSTTPCSISPIVLEEVINWMDDVIQDKALPSAEERHLKRTLKNLSLVQRRWTCPVRRVLGRSMTLKHTKRKKALKYFVGNPFLGPWTRHLRVHSRSGDSDSHLISVVKTLNIALAEQMTGLRKFVWNFERILLSTNLFERALSLLDSVNTLVLTSKHFPSDPEFSAAHYSSIFSMPSLRNLTLKYWDVPSVPFQGLPLVFIPFISSLSLTPSTPLAQSLSTVRERPPWRH